MFQPQTAFELLPGLNILSECRVHGRAGVGHKEAKQIPVALGLAHNIGGNC